MVRCSSTKSTRPLSHLRKQTANRWKVISGRKEDKADDKVICRKKAHVRILAFHRYLMKSASWLWSARKYGSLHAQSYIPQRQAMHIHEEADATCSLDASPSVWPSRPTAWNPSNVTLTAPACT